MLLEFKIFFYNQFYVQKNIFIFTTKNQINLLSQITKIAIAPYMNSHIKTVLLVDDEPNILVPLEFLVKQEGYRALTASNGRQALRVMEKVRPDLVLLDVMMPEMDGFETARYIRSKPEWNDVRIIFLTAKGAADDKVNGYMSGGEVYVTKPFDNDELIEAINAIATFG